MRRFLIAPVVGAMLLLTAAGAGHADPRIGIGGFLGYQKYAMDDVNTVITQVNEDLTSVGSPVSMKDLSGGLSFGGGLVVDVDPAWRLYAEYEHLEESTGGGNLVGSFRLEVNANAFLAGVTHYFPSTGKTRLGLGAGIGYYPFGGTTEGDATWGITDVSGSQDIGGSAVGYHLRGDLDAALSPKMHLELALGYRFAKGKVELSGTPTSRDLDWSGLMTRLGLTYFVK